MKRLSISNSFGFQIVEQTPSVLKLQNKRALIRNLVLLSGILSLLAGLPFIVVLDNLNTLKCNRLRATAAACELTRASLLRKHITPIPTGKLQGAEVRVGRDTHGSITYNLVLLTKNNSIPLRMSAPFSGVNGEEKEKREKSKKINSFLLNKEQTSLIIQQDDRLLIAILGGPHILFGSILIVTVLFWKLEISCLFDKSLGRMCLKSSNLLKQEKTREVMLHKIKKAVVVEETNKKGKKVSSLQLILSSGEEITLIQLGVRANNYEITQSINQFLGLTE